MERMSIKKVSCSISISKALLDEITEYARSKDENRSAMLEQFIREGFKREKKKAER